MCRTLGLLIVCLIVPQTGQAQPDVKADIRGLVARVNLLKKDNKGVLGTILVEGKVEKGVTSYDKAVIRITTQTKIERLDGKNRVKATAQELRTGARVQADFTGPVAESYPVQATASAILILESAKEK